MNSITSCSKDFSETTRASFFQNSSLYVVVGRGFLLPPMLWRPHCIAYLFKILPNPSYHCFQPSLSSIFDDLFLWLNGWTCHIWWLVSLTEWVTMPHSMCCFTKYCRSINFKPWYQNDLAMRFTHIHTKIHRYTCAHSSYL